MSIADSSVGRDSLPTPNIRPEDIPVEGLPIFSESDRLAEYVGERIDIQKTAGDEKEQLLMHMKEQSPQLNGNVEKALEQVKLNNEQLIKKESFLKKVLKFPVRHPYITLAAVASILYFTGAGAFLASGVESVIGQIPDGKIRTVIEGIRKLGGATTPGLLQPGGGSAPTPI
jgi:hypothetical protein